MSLKSKQIYLLLLSSFFILLSCEQYEDSLFEDDLLDTRASVIGRYQAEDHTFQNGCRKMSNLSGYTGSGFMDYGGNGSLVEWNNVRVPSAGKYILKFRYANGSSGNRKCAVTVNNSSTGSVSFSRTGSWNAWKKNGIEVRLNAGNNKIRVTANTGSGGPNLDRMDVLSNSTGGDNNGGDNGGGDNNGGGDGCNLPVHNSNYCSDPACGPCGEGEGDCDSDSDCAGELVCRSEANGGDPAQSGHDICVRPGSDNGGDDDDDNGGGGDDGGGVGKTVYTTESAPDLDTSDRLDFKNGLLGYKHLGDTTRCTLSKFNSLLGRKDIKTLYHSSHGFSGGVALSDKSLTCNSSATYQVENVIFATCDTLKSTCWKNKMGSSSKNILGYTNLSYDGIANQNAKKLASNINSGMSYVRAWYASNTSFNALKDRWCAYTREGSRIVEYSARTGNLPRYPSELEAIHQDEIVFADPKLLKDTRDFEGSFSRLNSASYTTDTGQEPNATFYDTNSTFLQKVRGLDPDNAEQRAEELKNAMPKDAALESIEPIEADGTVVAHRIRYIRTKDNLEIRSNGYEHHLEVIVNGDKEVSRSEFWPEMEVLYQSNPRTEPLMTVQETVLELADELVSIVRNSIAIVDVKPCYGSGETGVIVPAHCFMDTLGTTWVVDAMSGDLVE